MHIIPRQAHDKLRINPIDNALQTIFRAFTWINASSPINYFYFISLMRIPRIYTQQTLQLNTQIELEEQASIHLARVLRMEAGETIELFNGEANSFLARILPSGKKKLLIAVEQILHTTANSPLKTEIAISVSKGDKMEWIIQKATELGVHIISPIISARTDVRMDEKRWQKKCEYWQQVSISACEQSQRNQLVTINSVQNINLWLSHNSAEQKIIFHPSQTQRFVDLARPQSLAMCFGPEGGFSEEEILYAQQQGFVCASMGPRILRAETAPIAALAIAQAQWGDF